MATRKKSGKKSDQGEPKKPATLHSVRATLGNERRALTVLARACAELPDDAAVDDPIAMIRGVVRQLRTALQLKTNGLENACKDLDAARAGERELRAQAQTLAREAGISVRDTPRETMGAVVDDLKKRLEEARAAHREAVRENERLTAQIRGQGLELQAVRQELAERTRERDAAQTEVQGLTQELATVRGELGETTGHFERLKERHQELEGMLREARATIEASTGELAGVRENVRAAVVAIQNRDHVLSLLSRALSMHAFAQHLGLGVDVCEEDLDEMIRESELPTRLAFEAVVQQLDGALGTIPVGVKSIRASLSGAEEALAALEGVAASSEAYASARDRVALLRRAEQLARVFEESAQRRDALVRLKGLLGGIKADATKSDLTVSGAIEELRRCLLPAPGPTVTGAAPCATGDSSPPRVSDADAAELGLCRGHGGPAMGDGAVS